MDEYEKKLEQFKQGEKFERQPSCIVESLLFVVLFITTLVGLVSILGPYLSNLANSVFGMGLK